MDELQVFLAARLDEAEARARAASPWPWRLNAEGDEVIAADGEVVAEAFALSGQQLRATAKHIQANDPARVLREVAAKRAILAAHRHCPAPRSAHENAFGCWVCDMLDYGIRGSGWCQTVRLLAAVDEGHPDYDPAWAVHS